MKKFLAVFSFLMIFIFLGCQQPVGNSGDTYITNTINIVWQGSFENPPANPQVGWAYYNTLKRMSFVWDGEQWQVISQDGKSIVWKGELVSAPANPDENWAYFNIIDGNSYIYNGTNWDYLAKAGRDGASGIMLWLGTLESAPTNPSNGYCYYNSTDKCSYIWDGDSWEIIAQDGTNGTDGSSIIWKGVYTVAPSNPETNWAYYNTTTKTACIWSGTSWNTLAESLGGDTTVQVPINWRGTYNAAPTNPAIGDAYYNSTSKTSYIYDGSVWQVMSKDGSDGKDGTYTYEGTGYLITWKGSLTSAPRSPEKGWAYYNSTDGKSYIWDGSSWQIMTQDGSGASGGSSGYSYLYVLCYTSEANYFHSLNQPISEVSFGTVGLNSSAKTTTFYITLQSSKKETFKLTGTPSIQISGKDADCFSIVQPSVTEVNSGSYIMDAAIIFTPTSLGEKTATITIPNNSPDYPDFSFSVKGTGAYWPKTFDGGEGDGNDVITCSAEDSDGNLYFVGYGFELVNNHSGYDWWIKKFDKNGVEDTSNWNKKISFYDDYYSTYQAHYDYPKSIIIDSFDNIVVASAYNVIKFSKNGIQNWIINNATGNILKLYKDKQDSIYVVTSSTITKYSSEGNSVFTINKTGNISFDLNNNIVLTNSSNVFIYSGENGNLIKEMEVSIITDVNISDGWLHSNINSTEGECFYIPVENGKKYAIQMNNGYDSSYGDGSKTGYIKLSAYYASTGNSIFTNQYNIYSSPKTFTASQDDYIILKAVPNSSSYYGTYAIRVINSVSGEDITSGWKSGTVSTSNTSQSYTYSVQKGKTYILSYNDKSYGNSTKTGRIKVGVTYSDGTVIQSVDYSNYWSSGKFFIADKDDTVTLTVSIYSSSSTYAGTYSVVISEVKAINTMEKHILSYPSAVCFDSNNNMYVTGYLSNKINEYSKHDVFINKYNSGYELDWSKDYDWGHCENEQGTEIYYKSGEIIVVGTGNDLINGASASDSWCKIFDITGNLKQAFDLDIESASLISTYNNNYYFVAGSSSYYQGVYKVSPTGIILNKYGLNGNNQTEVSNPIYLVSNYNGSIYQAGYGTNLTTTKSGNDWKIIKY